MILLILYNMIQNTNNGDGYKNEAKQELEKVHTV